MKLRGSGQMFRVPGRAEALGRRQRGGGEGGAEVAEQNGEEDESLCFLREEEGRLSTRCLGLRLATLGTERKLPDPDLVTVTIWVMKTAQANCTL